MDNEKDMSELQDKIIIWANEYIQNPQNNDAIISDINKYVIEELKSENSIEEVQKITLEVIQQKKKILKQQEKTKAKEEKEKKEAVEEKEKQISILDLFEGEYTPTNSAYKMECPHCGMQGGRTEGFILFEEGNTAFCHTSNKWFKLLEAYALKKKIITCLDGREKDDGKVKILGGELFTLTLEEFKEEYGTDMYNRLIAQLKIRKRVELPGDNRLITGFADEIGDIYKSRNVLFFRGEANDVVEIGRYKKTNQDGEECVETGFSSVNGNRFITLAEMFIEPWTIKITMSGKTKIVKRSMTQKDANVTLESKNLRDKLPPISRIFDIQIPILYKKKLTFPKKGYDKRFGSWLPYNAPQIIKNIQTLEEAKEIINYIFHEFCFSSEKDKTHAIAAFITPFLRGLFPTFSTRTPIFIYMANRERAGKDYCAGCSGILYEGANIEQPAISNDEKGFSNSSEEIRKKITACMLQGKKRFHSANNKGLLNNTTIEAITTAPFWEDRLLGTNKTITLSNEIDFSLSGNLGIRLTPDLANRARIINLHLEDEDANARRFENPDLHGWILKNRITIISSLYKLVENWVDKEMPKGSMPFTSYPVWADVCGGIMEAAGYENPCLKDKTPIISLDNETEEMKQLFEVCFEQHPNEYLTKKEIEVISESEGLFNELDLSSMGGKVKFCLKIDKYVKRVLSGIMLNVDDLGKRADRRKYKFYMKDTENTEKVVGLRGFGKDSSFGCSLVGSEKIEIYTKAPTDYETLPKLPNPTIFVPETLKNSINVNDIVQNTSDFLKKEEEKQQNTHKSNKKSLNSEKNKKNEKIEKSDRELQFYESPETKDIIEQCSKEQVLELIKNKPKYEHSKIYKELGRGCYRFINELIEEGIIKPMEEGWEVIDHV